MNVYNKRTLTIYIIFISYLLLSHLGIFFDITKNEVKKTDLIICMGGGDGERLKKSISIFNKINPTHPQIISLDGNIKDREKKEKILKSEEFKNVQYLGFVKNTYEELKAIKEFATLNNYKHIIIVSSPPHSRRIDTLIKFYLEFEKENINYILISSDNNWWDKNNIFRSKKSLKSVISESFKLPYNILYYSFISKLNLSKEQEDILNLCKKKFIQKLNKVFSLF